MELSPFSPEELAAHLASATYARQAEGGAFLIAFDQDGTYGSANFRWFHPRYESFLYVDRVATAATHRRRGLAAALYRDVFAFAGARGLPRVVAEINSVPPNPQSDAFHDALGFVTVGTRDFPERGKSVRYVARPLR